MQFTDQLRGDWSAWIDEQDLAPIATLRTRTTRGIAGIHVTLPGTDPGKAATAVRWLEHLRGVEMSTRTRPGREPVILLHLRGEARAMPVLLTVPYCDLTESLEVAVITTHIGLQDPPLLLGALADLAEHHAAGHRKEVA
ncbi:hypothetical protein [Saccharopolyspora cebuensis]|uniref:Uncharacterized protein n=1 Tax=Saccharopolyspora cebuensis TaxID=418759 RepID=A0ABV4CIY3_9PSEU